jgi:hypothetical protein
MAFVEYAEGFNHNIKVLARDLARQFPTDAIVARIQKRTSAIIALDPLAIIDVAGPRLYKYRDMIYGQGFVAFQHFLDYDFTADFYIDATDSEDSEMASHIVPNVQKALRAVPAADQKSYWEMLVALLDDYIEYLAAKK